MDQTSLRFDVSEALGVENGYIAGTLFRPAGPCSDCLDLYVAIHGAGYQRRYWNAQFAGFPGYSYAEHVTGRGCLLLTLDMPGMGESVRPDPAERLNTASAAAALHQAVAAAVGELRAEGLAPTVTGIGHSLGGMMSIAQQAAHRSFDRLAVIGWANQPPVLGDVDVADLVASLADGYLASPRSAMRALFYAPDVPVALIEADEAEASRTPANYGRDALTPGIVHQAAAAIDCPVFLGYGAIDTSPVPHAEPGFFPASADVTLAVWAGAAHCHNFAATRQAVWARIDRWVESIRAEGAAP
jgi:pimeloyl-ACP methyl ester carboxylesterase